MTTRKDIREAFAILLQNSLTAVAPTSINESIGTTPLEAGTPLLVITSGASDRTGTGDEGRATFGTQAGPIVEHELDIYRYVRADVEADDTLDALDEEIAAAIRDNQNHALWKSITYAAPSRTNYLEQGSAQYKYEVTRIRIRPR